MAADANTEFVGHKARGPVKPAASLVKGQARGCAQLSPCEAAQPTGLLPRCTNGCSWMLTANTGLRPATAFFLVSASQSVEGTTLSRRSWGTLSETLKYGKRKVCLMGCVLK